MSDFSSIDDRLRQMYGVLARAGTAEQAPAAPPVQAPPAAGVRLPPVQVTAPEPPPPPMAPPQPMASAPMPGSQMPSIDFSQPIFQTAPVESVASIVDGAPGAGRIIAGAPDLTRVAPVPDGLAERSVVGASEARARAIIAAAEEEAAHLIDDARRQVRELSHQIDALISLREQLRVAPAAPAGPAADPGPESRQFGSLGGVVTVTAGPFSDTAAIEQFEGALVRIAELNDVYLRAFESGRAIFELTLHRPAAVLGELIRVSPEPISVVQESVRALVISLRGLTPGGRVQP